MACGPTSIASIVSSFGYDLDPVEITKLMLLDEWGNPLDFFTSKENGRKGMTIISFIYLLQELVKLKLCEIEYEIVKLSYKYPNLRKNQIIEMISNDYMALILVGPRENRPMTFSEFGHYIAVTSVNHQNNEFYIANPNRTGNNQIDTTYSYETIVSNMYSNTFDFLMIRDKSLTLTRNK